MTDIVALGPIGTRRKPKKQATMHLSIYLSVELVDRLDAWRARQYVLPPRIAVIRQILTDFLDKEDNSDGRHDP